MIAWVCFCLAAIIVLELLERFLLSKEMKNAYKEILESRFAQLKMISQS